MSAEDNIDFEDAPDDDWGDAEEIDDIDLDDVSRYNTSYNKCWICEICNITLSVESTIINNANHCFRCKQSEYKDGETETHFAKYYISSPRDLYWQCFECNNLNTNCRTNWCTFGDCEGKNRSRKIAKDIRYKPSQSEYDNDKSRIFIVNINQYGFAVYHRLCIICGARCHSTKCSVCQRRKNYLFGTTKIDILIQGYYRQSHKTFIKPICHIIEAYFICKTNKDIRINYVNIQEFKRWVFNEYATVNKCKDCI